MNILPEDSKPWSYEAVKNVLKSMRFDKREALARQFKSMRTINKIIAFQFDNLTININSFGLNDIEWIFESYEDQQEVQANKTNMTVFMRNKRKAIIEVEMSPELLYWKMLNYYVRRNTAIRDTIYLLGIPPLMEKYASSQIIKISARSMDISSLFFETYDKFRSLYSLDHVEHMKVVVSDASIQTLDQPEVKNCTNISLRCPPFRPLANSLFDRIRNFNNQTLTLEYFDFAEVERLTENWLYSNRAAGARFVWVQRDLQKARQIVKNIQERFGAHPVTEDRQRKNAVKVQMPNSREVTISIGQIKKSGKRNKNQIYPTLEIELTDTK